MANNKVLTLDVVKSFPTKIRTWIEKFIKADASGVKIYSNNGGADVAIKIENSPKKVTASADTVLLDATHSEIKVEDELVGVKSDMTQIKGVTKPVEIDVDGFSGGITLKTKASSGVTSQTSHVVLEEEKARVSGKYNALIEANRVNDISGEWIELDDENGVSVHTQHDFEVEASAHSGASRRTFKFEEGTLWTDKDNTGAEIPVGLCLGVDPAEITGATGKAKYPYGIYIGNTGALGHTYTTRNAQIAISANTDLTTVDHIYSFDRMLNGGTYMVNFSVKVTGTNSTSRAIFGVYVDRSSGDSPSTVSASDLEQCSLTEGYLNTGQVIFQGSCVVTGSPLDPIKPRFHIYGRTGSLKSGTKLIVSVQYTRIA